MFTIQQIEQAHEGVKSGADFPTYIQTIKQLGVIGFTTWVKDSHTTYQGENNYCVLSMPKYTELTIANTCNKANFVSQLQKHQQGETDYFTFCKDCAHSGIEKWVVNLTEMTCTYYDTAENEILKEQIPQ